ncbi:MAG: trimeric intracellular cation channel family protein [Pseudomonadota bacterium]
MNLLFVLEMLGTAAFAISGALAASRKNMDIFGFFVMALMPAVGGGTLRDLILDRPVFWLASPAYVAVALAAALAVFLGHFKPGGRLRLLVWMDAVGLALFAALGTEISLAYDAGPLVAVMLGVATGVAGGMIRDVICNEIPLVLTGDIYATAAFAAGVTYVGANALELSRDLSLLAAVLIGFAVRAAGIRYKLSLPSFMDKSD